jgi:uncharacterized membrane protein
VNRTVSRALWAGTLTGVGLCGAATIAFALDLEVAAHLARLGVLALFVTPPLRLAVAAGGFFAAGERRFGAASTVVLVALLAAAIHAAFPGR